MFLFKKISQFRYSWLVVFMFIFFLVSILFVHNNHTFYDRPIAKVLETTVTEKTTTTDQYNNEDYLYKQEIKAVIKNGTEKGAHILLTNEFSNSGAYDYKIVPGNELFISIHSKEKNEPLTGNVLNVKRDKYIVIFGWIFIVMLVFIGKKQGFFSIISFTINALSLSFALDVYVNTNSANLLWICGILVIIFTIISLFFVSGFHSKTYAAIITTLLGTFSSLFITFIAMRITAENGLHYEGMQFLTRPYHLIFLAGVFIGSLGAVMDVAITMTSSLFELYESNQNIAINTLKKSGVDIGRDIMGTITGILFFAYVSGTIPILILYLKNGAPLGYTISINLSLEIARALVGGIGVVLSIPISLYASIFFIQRKKAKV